MKTIFPLATIILLTLYSGTSSGMLVGKTSEDLYRESDVILAGNITIAEGKPDLRVTDYTINVEKYLKNNLNQKTLQITSSGCKNCNPWVEDEPIFSTGDRVLLYLNRADNTYQISPYSTVLYDAGYVEQAKKLEDAAVFEKLIPQLIITVIISSVVIVSGIIVYYKIRKKSK